MSEQSDEVNKMARKLFGSEVDAAAAASGLTIASPGSVGAAELGDRPWVELPGRGQRDVSDFAKDLAAHLALAPLFRRENIIVTVDEKSGMLRMMTAERFLTWIADQIVIYELVESGRGAIKRTDRFRRSLPVAISRACLQSDAFYTRLRELVRVNLVQMPIMRRDGKIELLPKGYDAVSGVFTLSSDVVIDEAMDLAKGKAILDDIYGEFSWADIDPVTGLSRSKAVAITESLALFGLGLQSVEAARMGFLNRANTQGGGKSLIAQMAITPSFGLPKNTPRSGEEEMRKVLDSAALQGASYLFFDNLKNHLESSLLEAFMTTAVWSGRVMATQTFFEAKKSTILLITGNNLTVSPDLQRRLLQCDVHVESFDLQEQKHRRELNPVVLSRADVRGEFLSALWAIMRHWDSNRRPTAGDPDKPYRVATFAEWSDIFGGIVQCAGWGNPLLKPSEDQSADQKTPHQRLLVESLAGELKEGDKPIEYTFQELIDCCRDNELFGWLLEGKLREKEGSNDTFVVNDRSASKMGRMFTDEMSGRIGRVYSMKDGRRIRFKKCGDGRAKRYRLEVQVKPVGSPAKPD